MKRSKQRTFKPLILKEYFKEESIINNARACNLKNSLIRYFLLTVDAR